MSFRPALGQKDPNAPSSRAPPASSSKIPLSQPRGPILSAISGPLDRIKEEGEALPGDDLPDIQNLTINTADASRPTTPAQQLASSDTKTLRNPSAGTSKPAGKKWVSTWGPTGWEYAPEPDTYFEYRATKKIVDSNTDLAREDKAFLREAISTFKEYDIYLPDIDEDRFFEAEHDVPSEPFQERCNLKPISKLLLSLSPAAFKRLFLRYVDDEEGKGSHPVRLRLREIGFCYQDLSLLQPFDRAILHQAKRLNLLSGEEQDLLTCTMDLQTLETRQSGDAHHRLLTHLNASLGHLPSYDEYLGFVRLTSQVGHNDDNPIWRVASRLLDNGHHLLALHIRCSWLNYDTNAYLYTRAKYNRLVAAWTEEQNVAASPPSA